MTRMSWATLLQNLSGGRAHRVAGGRSGDKVQGSHTLPVETEQPDGVSRWGSIETSGSIEAVNSMLLQHAAGVLRVFPDWPQAMDAAFTRLRAKGAYLISSEQKNGQSDLH
jgi:hypothetical protein